MQADTATPLQSCQEVWKLSLAAAMCEGDLLAP